MSDNESSCCRSPYEIHRVVYFKYDDREGFNCRSPYEIRFENSIEKERKRNCRSPYEILMPSAIIHAYKQPALPFSL